MENNRKIIHLTIFTSMLFLVLIGYLTYFQVFQSGEIIKNPYNRRQWLREENTLRGSIEDRNGIVLAETQEGTGQMARSYPYGSLYSHLVGYSHRQFGRSGIEAYYNDRLLGLTQDQWLSQAISQLRGNRAEGNTVVLTIDHQLQTLAASLLGERRGAVVALNPTTGEVLALVSKPDFDPNQLEANWEWLVQREDSPLLNRALSGLYPPGSTFKTIMAAAILQNPEIDPAYNCEGSIVIDGYTISEAGNANHGWVDLQQSLVVSCNTNFARMAQELGVRGVRSIVSRFSIDSAFELDIPITPNRFPYEEMSATDLAAVAIGQGKLLVTPLHMAATAGIFANQGVLVQPRVVKEIQNAGGRVLESMDTRRTEIISKEIADQVKTMMVAAVEEGTGRQARISGVSVGGKTGTAQNESGESHAWFIGFAPAEQPEIAVAVILEQSGTSGGSSAAPIARELIIKALFP